MPFYFYIVYFQAVVEQSHVSCTYGLRKTLAKSAVISSQNHDYVAQNGTTG